MITSIYPVPSICSQDQISDWFASLAECLHWNVRKKQKHFDELSDLTRSSSDDTMDSLEKQPAGNTTSAAVAELSDAKSATTQKSWRKRQVKINLFKKEETKSCVFECTLSFYNLRKNPYQHFSSSLQNLRFFVGQNLMNFLMILLTFMMFNWW